MASPANYIVKKYVPKDGNPELPTFRNDIGMAQGWISIFANFFLFALKLFFGLVSNSISLIADSFHTLSDMASSAIVVFGFKMSAKPPDKEHPFGHGRAETVAALTISLLIGIAGFEFLKSSIFRFMNEEAVIVNPLLFAVVVFTILVKEGLARLSFSLGDIIDSDTLKADAIHHRSDMFSSVLVLVAFVGVWLGYPKLDAVMGLGVAALMLYSAYHVARNAIDILLGKPAEKGTIEKIKKLAISVKGVLDVHDIVVHSYGAHKFISMHVEITEGQTPEYMHQVSETVESKVSKNLEANVVTHIDPVTSKGKEAREIRKLIFKAQDEFELEKNIQDLRIVKDKVVETIHFQVPVSVEFDKKDEFSTHCNQMLKKHFSNCSVKIEFKTQMIMN